MEPLIPKVTDWENLAAAWERVEENAGGPGVDGVTLEVFDATLEEGLAHLQRDIIEERYLPLPLLRVHMDKPGGGKRPLSIPCVRDRVAQTAVARVLGPVLEKEFEPSSFGYRRGRSVQQAVAKVRAYRDHGYTWVVDADIDSFFDEVDHEHLLARLRESISDEGIHRLIRVWLQGTIQEGGHLHQLERGIPQGSPISPLLANLYLDHFDEAIEKRGFKLIRYADDLLVLCKTQPQAEKALALTESLLGDLHLHLDTEKTRITEFGRGFRYLGTLFLRSITLPSPRRLQAEENEAVPPTAPPIPAKGVGAGDVHRVPHPMDAGQPKRVTVRLPKTATSMGRALQAALERTGQDSLELATSEAQPPPLSAALGMGPHPPSDQLAAQPEGDSGANEPSEPMIGEEAAAAGPSGRERVAVISAPFMRTLYIQEQGSVLARHDERLIVKKDDQILLEVPAAKIDQIFIFGHCLLTTPAMTFCLKEDIPVVLLSSRGNYYGILENPLGHGVALHQQQFARAADSAFCLAAAKAMVRGKLHNCRVLVQRHKRSKGLTDVSNAIENLGRAVARIDSAQTLEEIMGLEGAGAAAYFGAFGRLVPPEYHFSRRVRRPPPDPVNSLLSFGYTLLFYNVYALLRARGLHPYVGYLHALRDRHPSLASDVMEEFRAPIVDALVLYLLNSKLLGPTDFQSPVSEGGPCLLSDGARKLFLRHFEQKLTTEVTHPHTGYVGDWRRCIDLQVMEMAQWIRGEVAGYRPMLLK